ncbi:LppU/SCO3897 family protein [Catellatospora citrea]|uniref:Uncharacterized protein n=1 Tax=Catellatospora citrea TaxID=53366 RepID=A0A8J3KDH1_9ACTN|nr:hypothetical protein [Catellatospora citrea]RKE08930.1 hypothetical protein C8E86_3806 [Catellatospora citrea]GIG01197.1 hypothetical protein Cci01nite_62900 [Catellatospora citrea]
MHTPDRYPSEPLAQPTELLPIVQPPPRPRMGGRGPAIIGIALLAASLLIFLGVLVALKIVPNPFGADAPPIPVTTATPSGPPRTARFAQPGDCVANQGTEKDPDLVLTECSPGALEVLARFDATSDTGECAAVKDYRYHYFFDSELEGLDFVLCMGERP